MRPLDFTFTKLASLKKQIIAINKNLSSREPILVWTTSILLLFFLAVAPVWSDTLSKGSGIIALIALVFGWKALRESDKQTRIVLLGFCLYVATALPGLINNTNWHDAGWRFESYHPFLLAVPIWGLIHLTASKLLPIVTAGLVSAGMLLLGFTLYRHWYLDISRIGAWSGLNPNIFGYIAGVVSISLFAALTNLKLSIMLRSVTLLALFGAIHAIFASGSRGVLLAFLVSLVVISTLMMIHKTTGKKQSTVALGIVVLTILAIFIATLKSDLWMAHWGALSAEAQQAVTSDNYTYTSTNARVFMNLGAWQIWLENIWLGTGLGDAQNDFDQLKQLGPLITAEHPELVRLFSNHIFHNIFADSFATTGLLGGITMIITVLWLPLRFFLRALRHGDDPVTRFAALAGIGVGCINIIFGLTNSWLYLNNLPYTLTLILVFMVLVQHARKNASMT